MITTMKEFFKENKIEHAVILEKIERQNYPMVRLMAKTAVAISVFAFLVAVGLR